ncbi:MAG TPA: hypothetical protein P5186_19880 [Candidatus Paceibacterota bacterium]|nr:hypothetical protein [Verrucomicrobiota bacterium]HRY50319.1 hypothetical protein [Candidatus Paceibacterota bacterium]
MIAPTYTAAQIASALDENVRVIRRLLSSIVGSGARVEGGRVAKAWSITELPELIREQLAAQAGKSGIPIDELLSNAPKAWSLPVPISSINTDAVARAGKLREALRLPLTRRHEDSASLAPIGLAEFKRVHGYEISAKHWRRLFERAIDRDGGQEQFERIDLYIDDRACRVKKEQRQAALTRYRHQELETMFEALENKLNPTPDDLEYLWDSVFRYYEKCLCQASDPGVQKHFKGSLLRFLLACIPSLSPSPDSLRRCFDRKYSRWCDGGKAPSIIRDQRQLKSGNFTSPKFEADQTIIRELAILHNGNESLAHRLARKRGVLSKEFTDHYRFDPRKNKSYVPPAIREGITNQVNMCQELHRGPWAFKMAGPWIPRDHTDSSPGDYFSGDDVTWNSYWYYYDEDGRLHVERGECLLMIDFRTGKPLDFILIAGKYNSRHIRSVTLRIHDKIGLPRKGFYLERGVWASCFIAGDRNKRDWMHWRDTQLGLRDRGLDLEMRHAHTPRAKTIEGLLRILQERMRSEPGFVGFNERTEKYERMQEFIARVRTGKEDPRNGLLSMEQWAERISQILDEFANDPQNGKMLPGISPAEAWATAIQDRPLRRLPDEARYLLATHRFPVLVQKYGIALNIGGHRMLYANEHTGRLIGQRVFAYYNIDHPDLLTVSDFNRQNFFSVKRILLPAMTATSEQFAEANAQIRDHQKTAKVIYGNLHHRVVSTIVRDNDHDEATKELGRFTNAQVEEHKAEKSSRTRKLNMIRQEAAVFGLTISGPVRNPDQRLKGIQLMNKSWQKIKASSPSEE